MREAHITGVPHQFEGVSEAIAIRRMYVRVNEIDQGGKLLVLASGAK
jgi:hypothetical protein